MSKYWLNVDIPTKICTIHRSNCPFTRRIKETDVKGIGRIKIRGGWLQFNSIDEIREYFEANFNTKKYVLRYCLKCMKEL